MMGDAESWVESAGDREMGFPLAHLPYCVMEVGGRGHVGVGIGEFVLDLHAVAGMGLLRGDVAEVCRGETLNGLMELGAEAWGELRGTLTRLLKVGVEAALQERLEWAMSMRHEARLLRPARIPNYTDFYASIDHARRVGEMFRPEEPLMANYRYLPIGYHGRASSVVVSETAVKRPWGQVPGRDGVAFQASGKLDYEVELGFYVGAGNRLGERVDIAEADGRLFGVSLVNDWSARDLQAWEYRPLGPFLGKSFATTVSGWVTPMAALEPFRVAARERGEGEPPVPAYLDGEADRRRGGIDVRVEVWLETAAMRAAGLRPVRLSVGNARGLYWTAAQMVAHHTSNGCNLEVGDLLATGTISGAEAGTEGCLLEKTRNGTEAVVLRRSVESIAAGERERRWFLEDGDEVILRGVMSRAGRRDVTLGECIGRVVG